MVQARASAEEEPGRAELGTEVVEILLKVPEEDQDKPAEARRVHFHRIGSTVPLATSPGLMVGDDSRHPLRHRWTQAHHPAQLEEFLRIARTALGHAHAPEAPAVVPFAQA